MSDTEETNPLLHKDETPAVQDRMGVLHHRADKLEELLDTLRTKLEPVLAPCVDGEIGPASKECVDADVPNMCGLALAIDTESVRLYKANDLIGELINRIQV